MNIRKLTMLVVLLVVGVLFIGGCKKKSEPQPPKMPTTEETTKEVTAAVDKMEQTECPVMGGAVNKDIFVEYQGKKVYFCCAECKDVFLKEPDKFMNKLPQFSK